VFKPFHACAQICVYCQRNWEVRDASCPTAAAGRQQMANAIRWISENEGLREILITGGDPLMLPDAKLDWLLGELRRIPHIERIRVGSRVPVVLPMRITPQLVRILEAHQDPPGMTICLVTHVEHGYELTPDTARATGIDPYYCFNTKGKEETRFFRVPVARILQERKEEARLTPGTVRTDEPVFNLPRLGKNHLRAGQDHHVIGLRPDGGRVYEFLPWEKGLAPAPSYVYRDVPIYDYLRRLARRGERPGDYRNIWYYF
jgi:lysine 2,3-aminomutase